LPEKGSVLAAEAAPVANVACVVSRSRRMAACGGQDAKITCAVERSRFPPNVWSPPK